MIPLISKRRRSGHHDGGKRFGGVDEICDQVGRAGDGWGHGHHCYRQHRRWRARHGTETVARNDLISEPAAGSRHSRQSQRTIGGVHQIGAVLQPLVANGVIRSGDHGKGGRVATNYRYIGRCAGDGGQRCFRCKRHAFETGGARCRIKCPIVSNGNIRIITGIVRQLFNFVSGRTGARHDVKRDPATAIGSCANAVSTERRRIARIGVPSAGDQRIFVNNSRGTGTIHAIQDVVSRTIVARGNQVKIRRISAAGGWKSWQRIEGRCIRWESRDHGAQVLCIHYIDRTAEAANAEYVAGVAGQSFAICVHTAFIRPDDGMIIQRGGPASLVATDTCVRSGEIKHPGSIQSPRPTHQRIGTRADIGGIVSRKNQQGAIRAC